MVLVVELTELVLEVEAVLVVGTAVVDDVPLRVDDVLELGSVDVVDEVELVLVDEVLVVELVFDVEGLPGALSAEEPEPPQAVSTILAAAPTGDNRATSMMAFNTSRRTWVCSSCSSVAMSVLGCVVTCVMW